MPAPSDPSFCPHLSAPGLGPEFDLIREVAAGLRQNSQVRSSVNDGRPFAITASHNDPDLKELNQLAYRLLHQDLAPQRKIREEFTRAMKKRPIDPNLNAKFEFGLEGIETARSTQIVKEPRASTADVAPQFTSEFQQLQRISERIKVYLPIELDFDGRSYLGQLVEVNEGGANITGIRATDGWDRGTMRVVGDVRFGTIAIAMISSNAAAGSMIVRFPDQDEVAPLVAELRRRATS